MNHDSPGKAHAMGSCGTADGAFLLKELLGHGLATHNEGGAVLSTLYTLLGRDDTTNKRHQGTGIIPLKLVREITPCSTT